MLEPFCMRDRVCLEEATMFELVLKSAAIVCGVLAVGIACLNNPYIECGTGLRKGQTLAAAGVLAAIGLGCAIPAFFL